jgi:hypothetical protein
MATLKLNNVPVITETAGVATIASGVLGAGSASITDGGGSEAIDIDSNENVTVSDGYFRVHKAWMGDSTLANLALAVCVLGISNADQWC